MSTAETDEERERGEHGRWKVEVRREKAGKRTMLVVAGDGVGRFVLLLVVIDHHLDIQFVETLLRQADADVTAVSAPSTGQPLFGTVQRGVQEGAYELCRISQAICC